MKDILTFYWNPSNEHDIPNGTTHLIIGWRNQPLKEGDIPNSVTHLTFHHWFDDKPGYIPNSVTHLTCNFNQPSKNEIF